MFRDTNISNGSGSRTLPLIPGNRTVSSNEVNFVSVLCGTLSEDRGRVSSSNVWDVTITPENPDDPESDRARYLGSVNWRSN